MKKKTIEELRKEANAARWALDNAEQEEANKIAIPELKKSVGKCFKYMNSYGVGVENGRKWPLYVRVIGFDEKDLTFKTIQFQHTALDRVEVYLREQSNWRGENSLTKYADYIPITNSEYNRAKKSLFNFLKEKLDY